MINGFEYGWEDIQVVMTGKSTPIEGIVEVNYKTKKEHKNINGRGADPVRMGKGKKEYDGNMTLLQSEVESLQASLPKGKDLTDLPPFTVTVAYAPDGGEKVVDQLAFCRIGEYDKSMKSGDTNMEVKIPLIIGKINYNI